MIQHKLTGIRSFKVLLRLYPKEYRNEYEEEMLYLASAILHDADSSFDRVKVVARLANDFARSVIRQNIIAYTHWLGQRPSYLRYSSLSAIAMLTPYIYICAYNLVEHTAPHRRASLMQWETHNWAVYCVFLPATALIIVVTAAAIRVYAGLRSKDKQRNNARFTQDALILGVPLTLLTAVALL